MTTTTTPVAAARLPFTPTMLEVLPMVYGTSGYQDCAERIIALAEAMAAYIPAEKQDDAFRDGLRAFQARAHGTAIL